MQALDGPSWCLLVRNLDHRAATGTPRPVPERRETQKPKSFSRLKKWTFFRRPSDAGRPRVVVPAPGAGPRQLGRRRLGRPSSTGYLLARLPACAVRCTRGAASGHGRRTLRRRRRLRAGLRGLPRRVRRRVLRASRGAAPSRRRLAALPLLRDARLQALVDRGPRRRPARGPAHGPPHGRAPRRRQVAVKDPVITVRDGLWEMWLCEHPLTDAGARGPDVHVVPHQRRRPGLDPARHRADARRPAPGTRAAPGSRPCSRTTRSSCCTTAAPTRRGQLARDHLGRPRRRDGRAASPTRRRRCCARRTPTAPCATPRPSPMPDGSTRFYFELGPARRRARPGHDAQLGLTARASCGGSRTSRPRGRSATARTTPR